MNSRGKFDMERFLAEKKGAIDAKIERCIPRKIDTNNLGFLLSNPRYELTPEAVQKTIAEPIWDLLDRGGKRWRPALFLLMTEALGGDPEKALDFAVIPEIVHNGTLMADDVEDDSKLRRGKPCTHVLFGVDVAINAAEAMYFTPSIIFRKNRENFSPKIICQAYEVFCEELTNLTVGGQAVDIYWHKGANPMQATEGQYLQMCAYKTGTLARMAARLAVALSGGTKKEDDALSRFAETIGIAFQIQDDILNLTAESKKGQFVAGYVGSDITEGKRSLIVIKAIEQASEPDRKRLVEILNMHTEDKKLVAEAIGILNKYGSVEYARSRARQLVADAWKDADSVLEESEAKEKLRGFANYLIERDV